MHRSDDDRAPEPATETLRQTLLRLLMAEPWTFEDLRRSLDLTVSTLESELDHVRRSVARQGGRFEVEEPRCEACGFVFRGRSDRRLKPPSRCPKCREQRIAGPTLRVR